MATEETWNPQFTEGGKSDSGVAAESSANDVWEDCIESDVTRDWASTARSKPSHGQGTPSTKPPNVGQLWELNASLTKQIADLQFQLQRIIKTTRSDTVASRNLRGTVRVDTNSHNLQEHVNNVPTTPENDAAQDVTLKDDQAQAAASSSRSPTSSIVLHDSLPQETSKISARSPNSPTELHQKLPEKTTPISLASRNLHDDSSGEATNRSFRFFDSPCFPHDESPVGTPRLSSTPRDSSQMHHTKSPTSSLTLELPPRSMKSVLSVATPCRDRAPEERDEMELRRCCGTSDLSGDMTPDADFQTRFGHCESPSDVGTPLSNFGFTSDMVPPGRADGILYVRRKLTWAKRFASAEGAFFAYRKSRLSSVRFQGCLPDFTVQYLGYRRKGYRLLLKPKEPRLSDGLPDSLQLLLPREDVAEKWFRVLEWGSRLPRPKFEA